jgi:trk system potassium uptake protein TrkH
VGVVGITWVLAGVLGGLPFLLDQTVSHPVDALFEAVSGFTTTGATILETVEDVSRASLLWRSITHWVGGMGIIVLFVAIFPQLGVGARHLLGSEVPGPITERLRPRLKQTAYTLWWTYTALTALLTLLLWGLGLSFFDAINHGFSTLATGGFSTRTGSIGAYDNALIEGVVTLFMILAGVNFALYNACLQGRFTAVFRNAELKAFLGVYCLATCLVAGAIVERHEGSVWQAFRYASFQVAAIQTGAGFGTDDYDAYPQVARSILFGLMLVGGCSGSTTGGMKVGRVLVLVKAGFRELARTVRPQEVRALRIGAQAVPEATLRSITGFVTLFLATFVAATVMLSACGFDLESALGAAAATLGNVGPGLGTVGPTQNYAHVTPVAKSVLIGCMLLGRLEIVTMMALVLPGLWKKR